MGLYGPNIVWLVYGHFEANWWNPVDLPYYNCTTEEMLESIEGHFAIRFEVIGNEPGETIGRIVSLLVFFISNNLQYPVLSGARTLKTLV